MSATSLNLSYRPAPAATHSARITQTRRIGSTALAPLADEPRYSAMLVVTLLHVLALFWLLHPSQSQPMQPVLSFTVTLMDVSSSPNSVSSAASAASTQAAQPTPQEAVTEASPDARSAKPKKAVKRTALPTPQVKATQTHSAQQQTAVLAPTTPAQFDAAYLQNPPPSYPPLSRRMGEQGRVLLSVYVNVQGKAETIRVKRSSGFSRLDDAALQSVQRWRFAAAKQGEQLVASWVNVPVNFVLE